MTAPDDERRLTRLFDSLSQDDRRTLLAFAEFLAAGGRQTEPSATPQESPLDPEREPIALSRPKRETVIAAIRRLTLTYAMLDRGPMLYETAALMSAHVLQGRDATQVIDDLEALFLRHYQSQMGLDEGAGSPQRADNLGD